MSGGNKSKIVLFLALINLVAMCSIFAVRVYAIDLNIIVGLWMFDEGNGDIAHDSSENGNDGNVVQSKWIEGKYGGAMEFTGSGYVEVPASESLGSIKDEITIMAWIKFIDMSNWGRIITRGIFQDKSNLQFVLAYTDAPETVSLELHSDGQTYAIWAQKVLEQDVWHHIAYTSDGEQLKLYVDGVLKTSSGSGKELEEIAI